MLSVLYGKMRPHRLTNIKKLHFYLSGFGCPHNSIIGEYMNITLDAVDSAMLNKVHSQCHSFYYKFFIVVTTFSLKIKAHLCYRILLQVMGSDVKGIF